MSSSVVCISQTTGSLGEDVGRKVAEGLGFRYVDEEIVSRAAAKQGLDAHVVADVEQRKSFLQRWASELRESPGLDLYYAYGAVGAVAPAVPGDSPSPGSDDMRSLIREAISETADEGSAVIVSHAASMALVGREGILRVLVTASPGVRAGRLAAGPLDAKEAAKQVEQSDKARADYLSRFYDVDRELPTHYDLVLSTDVLAVDEVAAIVVAAARTPAA